MEYIATSMQSESINVITSMCKSSSERSSSTFVRLIYKAYKELFKFPNEYQYTKGKENMVCHFIFKLFTRYRYITSPVRRDDDVKFTALVTYKEADENYVRDYNYLTNIQEYIGTYSIKNNNYDRIYITNYFLILNVYNMFTKIFGVPENCLSSFGKKYKKHIELTTYFFKRALDITKEFSPDQRIIYDYAIYANMTNPWHLHEFQKIIISLSALIIHQEDEMKNNSKTLRLRTICSRISHLSSVSTESTGFDMQFFYKLFLENSNLLVPSDLKSKMQLYLLQFSI